MDYTIPLEDISTIMLESGGCTITSAALGAIANFGIVLFTCDSCHLPNGVLLPFDSHSRQLKMVQVQINMTKPFVKRLWQMIIKQKIINQSACLEIAKREGAKKLHQIASTVESGDKTFAESHAAQIYFPMLFDNWNNRRDDSIQNGALNYGYALFRAAIARSLSAYGFLPCIGIWHHNELNNFNFADDLIEPFRPVVDFWVSNNIRAGEKVLTPATKKELYNLFNYEVLMPNGNQTVATAIEATVSSLSSAISNNNINLLKLPSLINEVDKSGD